MYQYQVGKNLPTLIGGVNSLTVTELTPETGTGTYAKWRFTAVDFTSPKKKNIISGQKEHRTIRGWIDADGRWYN